jgi:hypothetical protein
VPENASPIRRETILLWSSGIMHEPIEIRRSGPVSNCHLFENFHGKRERLSCCTFEEHVRRKRQRNNSIFATAVDKQSHQHFSAAVAEFDQSLTVYNGKPVQRMLLDTGNQPLNVCNTRHNSNLVDSRCSTAKFLSAFGSNLTSGDRSGKLPITILGTTNKNPSILLDITTIDTVRTDLLSFFAMYEKGFDLHITLDAARMEHRETGLTIPLFLCPESNAWYMIYTVGNTDSNALVSHVRTIQDTLHQSSNRRQNSADMRSIGLPASVASVTRDPVTATYEHTSGNADSGFLAYLESLSDEAVENIWGDWYEHHSLEIAVVMPIFGEDIEKLEKDELPTLGNKSCLGSKLGKYTRSALHRLHGHQGHDPDCETCRRLRRTTRRAFNQLDDFKSMLTGSVWAMDVANHNVPAECGSTMFAIARDVKTGLFRTQGHMRMGQSYRQNWADIRH